MRMKEVLIEIAFLAYCVVLGSVVSLAVKELMPNVPVLMRVLACIGVALLIVILHGVVYTKRVRS